MGAGEIQRSTPRTLQPELRLPIVMRGTEMIFRYLMDTAALAEKNTTEQLEELHAIREVLEQINAKIPPVIASMEDAP